MGSESSVDLNKAIHHLGTLPNDKRRRRRRRRRQGVRWQKRVLRRRYQIYIPRFCFS
jgi:hypothetical protein